MSEQIAALYRAGLVTGAATVFVFALTLLSIAVFMAGAAAGVQDSAELRLRWSLMIALCAGALGFLVGRYWLP